MPPKRKPNKALTPEQKEAHRVRNIEYRLKKKQQKTSGNYPGLFTRPATFYLHYQQTKRKKKIELLEHILLRGNASSVKATGTVTLWMTGERNRRRHGGQAVRECVRVWDDACVRPARLTAACVRACVGARWPTCRRAVGHAVGHAVGRACVRACVRACMRALAA
jgi:hypothetical protein